MEKLGVSAPLLISQMVNFLLLLALLWFLLYKRVLGVLGERRQKIQDSLQEAERIRQEAAEARQAYERDLEAARRESQAAIAQATQVSEKVREEIVAEARQEARQILERAREQIEYERQQAMAELRDQVASLAILAAEKVIRQSLDGQAHRRLIGEFLTQTRELS